MVAAADFSAAPRFDLAAYPCFPSLGALDISDVHLPHDAAYYAASGSLFDVLRDDLVAAGFTNPNKKYLVYYDSPLAVADSQRAARDKRMRRTVVPRGTQRSFSRPT